MKKLDGKTALITGSTKGIGRAIAIRFADEGANVVITGRDEKEGRIVVENIEKNGGKALFIKADLQNIDENEKLVERTVREYGTLDILIPNAGILGLGSVTDVDSQLWKQTMNINLNSVFYLMRFGIPKMSENEGSSIVIIGSIASQKGFPNHAAYCASKGAVEALARQVAVDVAPQVRVNLIQPGPVDTGLYRASAIAFPNSDTILDEVPDAVPMKRVGAPDDIAKAALFLVSDDASWITGSVLTVDGGVSATG